MFDSTKLPELVDVDKDVEMASIGAEMKDRFSVFIESLDIEMMIEQKEGTDWTVEICSKVKQS